jgi:hypothetical protein
MAERGYSFLGGSSGAWRILQIQAVMGESLPSAAKLEVVNTLVPSISGNAKWLLRGVVSNERYVTRAERGALVDKQPVLGRPQAVNAALIPIRKSEAWWALAQDERRKVFEERSQHIKTGLRYLPAVARRLHHGRDLGEAFDFLTWFEYAPEHAAAFEEMVAVLRATEEWKYVIREVDIRLTRA